MYDLVQYPTASQSVNLVLVTVLLYLVLLSTYRLTLHPLAKYPGPFISKISAWSIPWQCATQDRHLIHLKEHQEYGSIVRIGPNTLSFSSPGAIRQIYHSSKENNPLRKSGYYDTTIAPSGAHSLHSETSRSKHAARRRVLDHAFTTTALRSNEPYLIDAVNTFCEVLSPQNGEEWSDAHDISDYATWFAYDVMGALVFDRQFDCLTNTAHRFVPKMITSSSFFLYIVGHFPCPWLVRPLISSSLLMNLFGGQFARDEHAYIDYAIECMADRLHEEQTHRPIYTKPNESAERKDMMHYIINAQKASAANYYGRKQLDADASLMIAAGSDTTSVTLAALFFYLTLPSSISILQRLKDEIRHPSNFPNLEAVTVSATISLTYLRACIDEALRLAPPVPSHLPRDVVQEAGLEIDGHRIPTGTTVGMSAYVLHHNEQAYPDSWSFDPGRWISDPASRINTVEQVTRAKEAFLPFSIGSRGCIGRDLAYRELCVCVARLVYVFDFRRAILPKEVAKKHARLGRTRAGLKVREDEYQLFDVFLVDREGPNVEFRRRDHAAM